MAPAAVPLSPWQTVYRVFRTGTLDPAWAARNAARRLCPRVADWFPRLRRLWGDGGYTGEAFRGWGREPWPRLEVAVVQRSDEVRGGGVLPRRRVGERALGGRMRPRRLVRDDARTESRAEAWVYLARLRLQLRRRA